MKKRIDRHTYFLSMAHVASLRGTCSRAKVGCILVHNNRIVGAGYNSSHSKTVHCEDDSCLLDDKGHCQRTIHAEVSALIAMDRPHKGLIAYVTHEPCMDCYKILAAASVVQIYYLNPHRLSQNKRKLYNELKKIVEVPVDKVDVEITLKIKEEKDGDN